MTRNSFNGRTWISVQVLTHKVVAVIYAMMSLRKISSLLKETLSKGLCNLAKKNWVNMSSIDRKLMVSTEIFFYSPRIPNGVLNTSKVINDIPQSVFLFVCFVLHNMYVTT